MNTDSVSLMAWSPTVPVSATAVDDLRELVAALDRRVPHLERDGEHAIARDAMALRAEALRRIAELSVVKDDAQQ